MDLRKTEILIPAQWVEIPHSEVKKGMTFRQFESTGEPVRGLLNSTIFIATDDADFDEFGIAYVPIEEIGNEENFNNLVSYPVYKISPRREYRGVSLVAAESLEKANEIIKDFKEKDINNFHDSWGYLEVEESDRIPGLFSKVEGIVLEDIWYKG